MPGILWGLGGGETPGQSITCQEGTSVEPGVAFSSDIPHEMAPYIITLTSLCINDISPQKILLRVTGDNENVEGKRDCVPRKKI